MILVTATLGNVSQPINGQGQHITGSISQEAGTIWSFSFDIYPTNVGFDLIQNRKTIIKAINTVTGRVEFAGRVLLASEKMSSTGLVSKSVTCESYLGYLCDSVQPFAEEQLYTLNDFIDLVLSNHNKRVEQSKRIYRGNVDVEVADTGYIYKGLQYQTTFETLKTKLVDVYGGELEIVESGGALYLNYLRQIGTTRSTPIKLGRNMQQASREVSPLNIITRVIPLGAKLKQQIENADGSISEQETEERLTLVGYVTPDGTEITEPWVDDTEKIDALGIVCGTLDCPDITEQSNLYRRVLEFMAGENRVELSHTLTALDLKEIGQDIDSLNCCDSYPVKNELIGLDETLRITKKTIDINAPYKGNITIGEKKATLTSIQKTETEKVNVQLQQLTGTLEKVNNAVNVTTSQVETLATNLEQTISGIVSSALASYVTASELETIKKNISTEITQSASGITTEFNRQITTVTDTLNGKISTLEEDTAYIRCYMNDEGQPVVELGAEGDGVISRVVNNRFSIIENGVELFYAYKNRLQATDITILRRLMVSGYAIDPVNDGSVSIFKVGV